MKITMELLNYEVLKKSGYEGYILESAPEKVMQFGEGNFLRAFVDYWFDVSNEKAGWNGKCVLVQPIPQGLTGLINDQEGLYTLYLRGRENGEKVDKKRVISSVSRCINPYEEEGFRAMMELAGSDDLEYVVSNTTEAGIVYDPSCRMEDKPCSSLEDGFRKYVNEDCTFCSTLVDRIVPGRIKDEEEMARLEKENGYKDLLLDVGEVFGVWNIEGPQRLEEKLPFKAAGLNCPVVPDVTPYKKRKVRILNGAHTGFVLGAYLGGFDIVRDCMADDAVRSYMNKMLYEEVIPTLPLDKEDLMQFAGAVQDRFNNPFVDHELMSISLNSTSKWRARNMPSLMEYIDMKGSIPACLAMSFAAYIAFYTNDIQELTDRGLVCRRAKGNTYVCSDDRWVLEFYWDHRDDTLEDLVHSVMTNEQMWGEDLTEIDGFEKLTVRNLEKIRKEGAIAAYASCL